jgi:2-polyprenyl-3-methyl-5-hydroxy-6-metoxy-1,4-benzoquinol methylase
MAKYSSSFDPDAVENTAASIYRLARDGGREVLDVGSGPGIVAAALAGADDKLVTCLDFDSDALQEAKQAGVNETHVVDLESPEWATAIQGRQFDTVILADVLEHVRRPEQVLAPLRRELVRDDGQLVVSIPNAAHQALVAELLSGHLDYTTTGLIDATHLRWFTRHSITDLLERCGFLVTEIHRTHRTVEQTLQAHRLVELPDSARQLLAALGDDAATLQYVLRARPTTTAGQVASVRAELGVVRRQLKDERDKQIRLEAELRQANALVEAEREFAFRELSAGEAAHLAVQKENARLRKRLTTMEKWNRDLRSSAAFRVGRLVAAAAHPGRGMRRVVGRIRRSGS